MEPPFLRLRVLSLQPDQPLFEIDPVPHSDIENFATPHGRLGMPWRLMARRWRGGVVLQSTKLLWRQHTVPRVVFLLGFLRLLMGDLSFLQANEIHDGPLKSLSAMKKQRRKQDGYQQKTHSHAATAATSKPRSGRMPARRDRSSQRPSHGRSRISLGAWRNGTSFGLNDLEVLLHRCT